MVGMSGDILTWIDHLLFKVLRSRPKINLSMLIKKKGWREEGWEWDGGKGRWRRRCG
jgi:hypothetical protein